MFASKGIDSWTMLLTQTSAVQEFFWPFQQEKDKNRVCGIGELLQIATLPPVTTIIHACITKPFLIQGDSYEEWTVFPVLYSRSPLTQHEGSYILQIRKSRYSLYAIL